MDLEIEKKDYHEAKMAKADLYKLAKYSAKLFNMIKEGEELDGWVQAKITKASDYISSVVHYLEYEQIENTPIDRGPRDFEEGIKESVKRELQEKWSEKYKRSINCSSPRGFSQRAHCAGRKK